MVGTLDGIDLPKWTAIKLTGMSVTTEQASEIIRRTDSFIQGDCNSHIYGMHGVYAGGPVADHFGVPKEENLFYSWARKRGKIPQSFLTNDWIFRGGTWPHSALGWCNPSGALGFIGGLGRHFPKIRGIMTDVDELGKAFPFLELAISVLGKGTGPVATIHLIDGKVIHQLPGDLTIHATHPAIPKGFQDRLPADAVHLMGLAYEAAVVEYEKRVVITTPTAAIVTPFVPLFPMSVSTK